MGKSDLRSLSLSIVVGRPRIFAKVATERQFEHFAGLAADITKVVPDSSVWTFCGLAADMGKSSRNPEPSDLRARICHGCDVFE